MGLHAMKTPWILSNCIAISWHDNYGDYGILRRKITKNYGFALTKPRLQITKSMTSVLDYSHVADPLYAPLIFHCRITYVDTV